MKILFLSDNFPPEVNAPASRTYEHAKRWVASGAEVTVITCAPNFPKGRVHAGYRNRWRQVETVDGIRVVRVKSFITGNEGFALRILDYLSFMASAFFFGLFEKRPHVVVGTSPQFFAAMGAWLLSVAKWRPFVFELRDLWPASIVTVGAMKKGLAIRLLEKIELFLYRRATLIVAVTESFKKDLVARGIPGGKIAVIRNGVDLERYQPLPRSANFDRQFDTTGKFVVAYYGTHGMAHGLENVLRAAQLTQANPEIRYLLVGDGACKNMLLEMAQSMALDNVIFHDSVPKQDMPGIWSVCDLALVHLKDASVFSTVIPSKIFEAFGVGKAILIVQPDGEAAELVRSANAGIWVPPDDPQALSEAVMRCCADREAMQIMAQHSRSAAYDHSRDKLANRMLELMSGALDRSA